VHRRDLKTQLLSAIVPLTVTGERHNAFITILGVLFNIFFTSITDELSVIRILAPTKHLQLLLLKTSSISVLMKKVILVMMLAGSAAMLQACHTGNATHDAPDSAKTNTYEVSNIDTSKTVTSTGGATLLDYTASGGTTMPKGKPSARTTMNAPAAAAAATPAAAADTAKADSTKK
jgi:hypothetical protein